MHLMLHIFKKDVHRLWPAMAAALFLQAAVAYFDATRNTAYPGGQEGWMTILLLLTWGCLIALAVHEDSLVGDRQFWISRPYRWPTLLGAKLLFAAAIVHVPSFLADAAVLAARGFHPWEWLPRLLGKQLMLAAAFSLPMMALAAVLQNFAQVAMAAVALSAITVNRVVYVSHLFNPEWLGGLRSILLDAFLTALFVVSVAVICLQFARRETWRSRGVGISAVVVFVLLFSSASSIFFSLRAALGRPDVRISIEAGAPPPGDPWQDSYKVPPFRRDDRWVVLKVPIHAVGVPKGVSFYIEMKDLELTAPDGRRYTDGVENQKLSKYWLLLRVRRPLFEQLKNSNVELKSTAWAMLYRGERDHLPLESNRPLPAGGRCSNEVGESRGAAGEVLIGLRVVCESPAGFPLLPWAGVELSDRTGRGKGFAESSPSLSPLDRVQVSFDVRQPPTQLSIERRIAKSWQAVKVDLRNLHLSDYVY